MTVLLYLIIALGQAFGGGSPPVGTAAGNLVQLDNCNGTPCLPAVDGSQLTNLPSGGGGGLPTMTVTWSATTVTAGDAVTFDVTLAPEGVYPLRVVVWSQQGGTTFTGASLLAVADGGAGTLTAPPEVRDRAWFVTASTGRLNGAYQADPFSSGTFIVEVSSVAGLHVQAITVEAPE